MSCMTKTEQQHRLAFRGKLTLAAVLVTLLIVLAIVVWFAPGAAGAAAVAATLPALSDATAPARIGKMRNRIVIGLVVGAIGFVVFAAFVLKW
jgi:hypothetical protein